MKKHVWIIVLGIIWTPLLWAQTAQLTIKKATTEYKGKLIDSWSTTIDSPFKTVKKDWNDYIEDNYQAKVQGIGFLSNKTVLTVESGKISDISVEPTNLFLKVTSKKDKTNVALFGSNVEGQFISRKDHPKQANALQKLFSRFIITHLTQFRQAQVKMREENYQDLTDSREDMLETIEDNKEEIIELKEETVDLSEENNELIIDLRKTTEELEEAEKRMEEERIKLEQIKRKKSNN